MAEEMEKQDILDLKEGKGLTRRQFLKMVGLAAGSGFLAACAEAQQQAQFGPTPHATATEPQVLESPIPPDPDPPDISAELARFLAFSSILTGFENLSPRVGQIYMESLESNPDFIPLADLYAQAGFESAETEVSLEEVRAARIFDEEPTRLAADEILKMWYTGVFTVDGEPQVATFVDSLAWKGLRFTKPATICGSFGFWATEPDVDVSR